jgi:DNA-binding protein Fis
MTLANPAFQTMTPSASTVAVPPNASIATRQMSPLYRARAEAFNDSLPASVDACLKTYFKDLNGMSPAAGMYIKVISQVEKPLIEHVLR